MCSEFQIIQLCLKIHSSPSIYFLCISIEPTPSSSGILWCQPQHGKKILLVEDPWLSDLWAWTVAEAHQHFIFSLGIVLIWHQSSASRGIYSFCLHFYFSLFQNSQQDSAIMQTAKVSGMKQSKTHNLRPQKHIRWAKGLISKCRKVVFLCKFHEPWSWPGAMIWSCL